uniref:SGNH hydrolase-type esterase domain-containing protein n=1 Tax=Populus alba TaxID=43335 RepID=A0A4U5MIG2_POPAL|nr:hypothetical protein D5086_0000309220 [Populus alba]
MRPQIVLFGDSITEQSFRSGGWGSSLANTYSRKADVLVRGYGGYNTRWALFLLTHIFPLNSTKPPAATTIFFGANDAALLGRNSERQHHQVHIVPFPLSIEFPPLPICRIICCYNITSSHFVAVSWIGAAANSPFVHSSGFSTIGTSDNFSECSPAMLVVLITPPPVDEEGRKEYAKSLYGEKAMQFPERTNEMAGVYARQCVELAKDLGIHAIDLWSKMQGTDGWQKKFLSDGLHLTPEGNAVVHEEVVRVFSEAWLSAADMPYDFPHHSEIDGKNPEKAFLQKCL